MATPLLRKLVFGTALFWSIATLATPVSTRAAIQEGTTFGFTTPSAIPAKYQSWNTLFPLITTAIINTAVILFVVLILIGGLQYLTSAGDDTATTKAKKLLLDATVGLFLVLAMQAIAFTLITWFGGTQYLQYLPRYPWTSVSIHTTSVPSTTSNSSTVPTLPDGQPANSFFAANGKNYYYDGSTLYTVQPPNGITVAQNQDGSYTITNSDKSTLTVAADGTSITKDSEGNILTVVPASVDGITRYNTLRADVTAGGILTPVGDTGKPNGKLDPGGDGGILSSI